MTIISSIFGAILFLLMFYALSSKFLAVPMGFHLISFVVLLVMMVFLPVDGSVNAMVFYFIVAILFRVLYQESSFSAAVHAFLMFAIHYGTAIMMSNIHLYLRAGVFCDYRYVFQSADLAYSASTVAVAAILVLGLKNLLNRLNKHFDMIKTQQIKIFAVNIIIFAVYLFFMKLNLDAGVNVVQLGNTWVDMYMAAMTAALTLLLAWLVKEMNARFVQTSTVSEPKRKTDALEKRMKAASGPLSIILLRFVNLEEIKRNFGGEEKEKLINEVLRMVAGLQLRAEILRAGDNAFVLVCDGANLVAVKKYWEKLSEALEEFNERSNEKMHLEVLAGIAEYDPKEHLISDDFLRAAYANLQGMQGVGA